MNKKIILIFCLSFLFINTNMLHAEKKEFDYKISGGKLYVFDHVIEPEQGIKKTNAEDDTIIIFNQSPDGKWIIIQIGADYKTEYWVYNTQSKLKPHKIKTEVMGKHSSLLKHENNFFIVNWWHRFPVYNFAEFFTHEQNTHVKQVDFLLLYDTQLDIYVSAEFGMEDKILVGKVFSKNSKPIEKEISLGYEYLSDALSFIKEVQIENDGVKVQYIDKNNTLNSIHINTKNP